MSKKTGVFFGLLILLAVIFFLKNNLKENKGEVKPNEENISNDSEVQSSSEEKKEIVLPIARAGERITKKYFGLYSTPQDSPVDPEHFTGYHTGTDFEVFPEEEDIDVPIFAICDGTLTLKKMASGYGGVIVEECQIEGEKVSVIYGHLRLASVSKAVGERISTGEKVGLLGTGFSEETDTERKHLHLDIYKGPGVDIRGYVQNKNELSNWIDPEEVLGL